MLAKNIKIKIYITIILLVVIYGCATWSVTMREEHRLRGFQNGMLRNKFGPKKEEDRYPWPRVLRRGSASVRSLGLWVRILRGALDICLL
jgi:hypothetical protein